MSGDDKVFALAICAGAARALRTRAAVQRQRAAEGILPAGAQYPGVVIRSGEAAIAANLAAAFTMIAAEIEAGGAS